MTADTRPRFTVVIPLYNKERHLRATLASIEAQTFENYEVVIVDDGSTDDGPAIAAAMPSQVRVIRQRNAGPGMARNRAIDSARGEWIAFLDADDWWRADHLATLDATIVACPEADVVITGFARGLLPPPPSDAGVEGKPRYFDFFEDYRLVWTSALAVRVATVREERFGAAWPGEDVELWLRLARHHRFAAHPARTALYVQATGGAMDSQASAPMTPPTDQPIFRTIAAMLADSAMSARHADLAKLRNALLLDFVRPSLFLGKSALARAYLRALHAGGGRAPLLYVLLAHLPGPVARACSQAFAAGKRAWRRWR